MKCPFEHAFASAVNIWSWPSRQLWCADAMAEQIFAESQRDRTRSFLRSIREAKRL
jgi:hypothetical protein